MLKCLASKQRPKPKPKEKPKCPLDCLEEERRKRYERLKFCAPAGFQAVLEKIIRNVVLSRPINIYLFIADLLDAEISRRTFDDIVYGCQLKKSLKSIRPYPTESCTIIKNWMMFQDRYCYSYRPITVNWGVHLQHLFLCYGTVYSQAWSYCYWGWGGIFGEGAIKLGSSTGF